MTEIARFDVGRYVECDFCGLDLTDDPRPGGFIFTSKGAGPCCAERVMASIVAYDEQRYLQGECPPESSFADWIRQRRAAVPGGSEVRIYDGLPWPTDQPTDQPGDRP